MYIAAAAIERYTLLVEEEEEEEEKMKQEERETMEIDILIVIQ